MFVRRACATAERRFLVVVKRPTSLCDTRHPRCRFAAHAGHAPIAQLLVDKGADVNAAALEVRLALTPPPRLSRSARPPPRRPPCPPSAPKEEERSRVVTGEKQGRRTTIERGRRGREGRLLAVETRVLCQRGTIAPASHPPRRLVARRDTDLPPPPPSRLARRLSSRAAPRSVARRSAPPPFPDSPTLLAQGGSTALMLAARNGEVGIARLLVRNGVALEAEDEVRAVRGSEKLARHLTTPTAPPPSRRMPPRPASQMRHRSAAHTPRM